MPYAAERGGVVLNTTIDRYAYATLVDDGRKDEELGIAGGMQDQYAASFGGFNFMEFGAGGVVVNPLRISAETINELHSCLVLCYTGGTRLSAQIIDKQVGNYQAGHEDTV